MLCFSLDTKLIQELAKPNLHTLWIPVLAWVVAVLLFSLVAKHTRYLIYPVQICYLALFCPVTVSKLTSLSQTIPVQTILVFTIALILAFIESFPPSFIQQRSKQLESFDSNSFKIQLSVIFSSIQSYLLLVLFAILYLVTSFHPLFNGSTVVLDQALMFIISIPFIYATRRLQ